MTIPVKTAADDFRKGVLKAARQIKALGRELRRIGFIERDPPMDEYYWPNRGVGRQT